MDGHNHEYPKIILMNKENSPVRRVMEITTIVGCKVSCVYCPQKKFVTAYKNRSDIFKFALHDFKKILAKIPADVDIFFCGMSEPFLNPACASMIGYAHQRGHKISIDTTLVGMTLADLEQIKGIPLQFLAIHLPSAEGYENINVDADYLELLNIITNGGLDYAKLYLHYYGETLHKDIKLNDVKRIPLYSRGGSIKVESLTLPTRARGKIGCRRNLRYNILLPNGDVLLCSTDWEMKHIIGNLNESDYDSLFSGEEFQNIVAGLSDEKIDILCRFCESHMYDADAQAKLMNLGSRIRRILRK